MVRGKDDFIVRRLSREFNDLGQPSINVKPLTTARPSPRHNSRAEWQTWIRKYSEGVLHLLFTSPEGDPSCGTAFHIGKGTFATARHNVFTECGAVHDDLRLKHDGNEFVANVLAPLDADANTPDVALLSCNALSKLARIPTQVRLPELGEEIVAIGFPSIPQRNVTQVVHSGIVEALPVNYSDRLRFIQVSFQSGGGLSGGSLIDAGGNLLGVVVENVFMQAADAGGITAPSRPYGQAVPVEYLDDLLKSYDRQQRPIR
ncbi:trypsin-like peptidase domain-containing protein [Posidoniimonas polymericola]|nr:trypsin-like peptidase domain-containing protein [Posidoniimonas polymericola]